MATPMPFDQAVADDICDKLVEGMSLRKITLDAEMPSASTVFKWLRENETFAQQYAHARDAQADTLADEILDIADDGSNDWMGDKEEEGGAVYNGDAVARSRLRVDARKWISSKLKPKVYGDKTLLGSDPDNPLPTGFIIEFENGDSATTEG